MDNVIHFPLSPEKARDDKRAQVARPYLDHLFAFFALNGNFQWYDGNHEITRRVQLSGADVSLVCKCAHVLRYAEVKTDFHMPYRFCFEALSNTKMEPPIPGWMKTAKADRLVYSFVWLEDILDVFVIDFPALQRWFWKDNNYLNFTEHTMPNTQNNTRSCLIEVDKVWDNVLTYRHLVTRSGEIIDVSLYGQHPVHVVRRILDKRGIPFKRLAGGKGKTA